MHGWVYNAAVAAANACSLETLTVSVTWRHSGLWIMFQLLTRCWVDAVASKRSWRWGINFQREAEGSNTPESDYQAPSAESPRGGIYREGRQISSPAWGRCMATGKFLILYVQICTSLHAFGRLIHCLVTFHVVAKPVSYTHLTLPTNREV